jgi:hypothetical protein
VAREVVLFSKQTTGHSGVQFSEGVLDELLRNMGNVAGVLHIVPAEFVSRVHFARESEDVEDGAADVGLRVWRQVVLNNDALLEMFVDYDRAHLYARIVSKVPQLGQFAIAVNRNAIGLVIAEQPAFPASLEFADQAEIEVPVRFQADAIANLENAELQIALRTSGGTVFGAARIPVEFATVACDAAVVGRFAELFRSLPISGTVQIDDARLADDAQLAERNVFVAGKAEGRVDVVLQLIGAVFVVAELAQKGRDIVALVKASHTGYLAIVQQSAQALFGQK